MLAITISYESAKKYGYIFKRPTVLLTARVRWACDIVLCTAAKVFEAVLLYVAVSNRSLLWSIHYILL